MISFKELREAGGMAHVFSPWKWQPVYDSGRPVVAVAVASAMTRNSVAPFIQYLQISIPQLIFPILKQRNSLHSLVKVTAAHFLDRRRGCWNILPLIQVIRRRGHEADKEKRAAEHDEGVLATEEAQGDDILARPELCQSHQRTFLFPIRTWCQFEKQRGGQVWTNG